MKTQDRHSSVTSLLMLGVLSATLLYTCIFIILASSQIGVTTDRLHNRSLEDQAYIVATFLDKDRPHSSVTGAAVYQYIVRDAGTGDIAMQSPGADPERFPPVAVVDRDGEFFAFHGPHGERYRGASIHYRGGGRDNIIQIAQDEDSIRAFSTLLGQSFFARMSLFGIPFLALLMLVVALSIKLIMSPIAKALGQLGQVSFDRPDLRLDVSNFPSEIQPLAGAINGAFDRVGRGIEAQKDFIANAAHELRTPLAVLRAHIDTLQDQAEAGRMRQDVDSMARMVTQLLDTARLDAPERPEMARLDLAALCREAGKAIWPLMIAGGRKLDVYGTEQAYYIEGNADLLGRALRNLLENALHHTPAGMPVELELKGNEVIVRDHGTGVPDDHKSSIFGRFARGDSQKGGGAGLGLFIVRRIMELHGGDVRVGDAAGGGAVFVLRFPVNG